MKKLRYSFATIALLVSLSVIPLFQGMGAPSAASAASSHHVNTSSAVAFIRPPCGTASDC